MAVKSNNLLSSSLLNRSIGGEIDPMASLGNLMDVMLVFACGLMIALIVQYDVELSPSNTNLGDVERFDAELEAAAEGIASSDSQYAEVGTVYKDIETGEYYVLSPNDTEEALTDMVD